MPLLPDHADADRRRNADCRHRLLPAALASLVGHGALLAAVLANALAGQSAAAPAAIPVMLVEAPTIEAAPLAEPTSPATKPAPVPAAAATQPTASPLPVPAPASVAAEAYRHVRPAKPRPDRKVTTVQAAPSLTVEPGLPPAPSVPSQEVASSEQQSPARAVAAAPSADYFAAVMAALERQKHYPEAARLRQEQGTVLIDFAIDRAGRVLSTRIRHGSGSASLDGAAEAMVHRADPLPAPPTSYPATQLELVLPVTFSLQ